MTRLFQTDLISIVNLRLVPWGNAWIAPNASIICQIDLRYAKETSELKPLHRFVPWVVVNNQALQEDYRNFVTYICRAYKGQVIPSACRSSSLSARTYDESNEKVNNSFIPVCYADEARNLTIHFGNKIKQ
ncbi:hypothetical protein ACSQ67_008826 [Phaseolus vulgaris]